MGPIVNKSWSGEMSCKESGLLDRKGHSEYYMSIRADALSYYQQQKPRAWERGGWICIWRHARLRSDVRAPSVLSTSSSCSFFSCPLTWSTSPTRWY